MMKQGSGAMLIPVIVGRRRRSHKRQAG